MPVAGFLQRHPLAAERLALLGHASAQMALSMAEFPLDLTATGGPIPGGVRKLSSEEFMQSKRRDAMALVGALAQFDRYPGRLMQTVESTLACTRLPSYELEIGRWPRTEGGEHVHDGLQMVQQGGHPVFDAWIKSLVNGQTLRGCIEWIGAPPSDDQHASCLRAFGRLAAMTAGLNSGEGRASAPLHNGADRLWIQLPGPDGEAERFGVELSIRAAGDKIRLHLHDRHHPHSLVAEFSSDPYPSRCG
ncbi:MAG: hypothetical protein ABW032_10110 [Burkholderiaceae bacterium]